MALANMAELLEVAGEAIEGEVRLLGDSKTSAADSSSSSPGLYTPRNLSPILNFPPFEQRNLIVRFVLSCSA